MTRVLVVARSALVRAGLESLLARAGDFIVVGSAEWHPADAAAEHESDVVVIAIEPGEDPPLPLALAPDAAPRAPAVVVLGPEPLDAWAPRALRAGARAVLPRNASAEEIAAALHAAALGLVTMPAPLAGREIARLPIPRGMARFPTSPNPESPPQALTPRELEILGLLAAGLANRAIAAQLGISEHTVKSHVAALFGKLGVSTRAEAVARGVRLGLLML